MEKLELKVGDFVRLVGPSWADYDDDAVGKIVRVDRVTEDGDAYSDTYGSLTTADGIPYCKETYYVEKVEEKPEPGTVTLPDDGRINIDIGDKRLTVRKSRNVDGWHLSVGTASQDRSISVFLYQSEIDDLRAFLEYWSTHGN